MLGRTVTEILPAEIAHRFSPASASCSSKGRPTISSIHWPCPEGGALVPGARPQDPSVGRRSTFDVVVDLGLDRAQGDRGGSARQRRQLELLSRTSQQLNWFSRCRPSCARWWPAEWTWWTQRPARRLWTGEMMQFSEYNNDGLLRPIKSSVALGEGVSGVVAEPRRISTPSCRTSMPLGSEAPPAGTSSSSSVRTGRGCRRW